MTELMRIQNIVRLYHWNTKNYARHIASGAFYDGISVLTDTFVEVLQTDGKRISIKTKIELYQCTDKRIVSELSEFVKFLSSIKISKRRTDLLNLRDEMLALTNKTLYLFTLE